MKMVLFWLAPIAMIAECCVASSVTAGDVQVKLSFEEPLYCNMPVWAHVTLMDKDGNALAEDARYPMQAEPWFFGDHNFVVKHDGKTLLPIRGTKDSSRIGRGWGSKSAAPASVRRNWFPLHLWYRFAAPGVYSVQYSNEEQEARSDWARIKLRPFTAEQRHNWLKTTMTDPPGDVGKLVSEYLPSILAYADRESLSVILKHLHHKDRLVEGYATYGLYYYDESLLREEIPKILAENGATYYLSHFLSWKRAVFQPVALDIVKSLMPFLETGSARQAGEAIRSLGFMKAHYSWDNRPEVKGQMEDWVFQNLDNLLGYKDSELLHALAVFMGGTKTEQAREVLWQLSKDEEVREQALICLAWHAEKEDLARLAEIMISGDEKAWPLPYHLRRAYSREALPYLRKGLRECPNSRIKLECARELALEGEKEAFQFFRDQLEARAAFKDNIVQFVRDHFKVPGGRSEEAVVKYVKTRSS